MEYIFPTIGLIILSIAIIFAVYKRHNTGKCISFITLGIFFSTFFMVLPTEWIKTGAEVANESAYSALSSLLYSFKTLGGRQDITQLETIQLTGILKGIYIGINYISFVLAPVLASSLILSFFGDFGEKLRMFVRFSKHCHIFSELNENSLSLAKGIKRSKESHTIVFCKTKNASKSLVEEARKLGGITLYKSCPSINLCFKYRYYKYYLIASNEDDNVTTTISLIKKHKNVKANRITINAFAQSSSNIKVVESLDKGTIKLRFIDEIALFCNNLLFEHPLYCLPGGSRDISVMLVGCGRTGLQMLKTVVWCGQLEGYSLRIRAYDKDAERIKKEFFAACPELQLPDYDIQFIACDVTSLEFEEKIIEIQNQDGCPASYVVVATGDDQLNIAAADYLRGVFRRNGKKITNNPPIYTRVRSGTKQSNNSDYLKKRNITPFGNIADIFTENTLFNTQLERLAFAVHLCYNDFFDQKQAANYAKVLEDFETHEYDRRASMAAALHIKAKLQSFKILTNITDDKTAKAKFEEMLINDSDSILEKLAQNEHIRWNAFMRSEGYRKAEIWEMAKFKEDCQKHKDDISKLHPCMTTWDDLDNVGKEYTALFGKPDTFKVYDRKIVKNTYKMLQFAQIKL